MKRLRKEANPAEETAPETEVLKILSGCCFV